MDSGVCIIIVLLLILILTNYRSEISEYLTTSQEVSNLDLRTYKVASGFSDSKDAANHMAKVHSFIIDVLANLKKKFIINGQGTQQERAFVQRVLNRYNPDVLFENDPEDGGETSYVVNKGDKFAMCLRSKNLDTMDEFHSASILQFVALHELSHLGSPTYGHDRNFWEWFRFMLIEAKFAGLHEPVDYSENSVVYCGLPVRKNPYFHRMY